MQLAKLCLSGLPNLFCPYLILSVQVRLSSAAVPDEKDDTTVVIGPPFYLSAKLFGKELPIQVSSLSNCALM